MENIVEPKKRRGRKSKAEIERLKVEEEKKNFSSNSQIILEKNTLKKSKPKYIYSSYEETTTNEKNTTDDENIIIKLNINSNNNDKIIENELQEKQDQPYAYNQNEYDEKMLNISNFSKSILNDENETESQSGFSPDDNEYPYDNLSYSCSSGGNKYRDSPNHNQRDLKVVNLLKDFREKNKNNEWPSNTSISCYWCCSQFNNAPYGIPVSYNNGHFYVFGCFCSLECAAAYNFNEKNNIDDIWERYSLINLLNRTLGYGNTVRPAPDRLCLNIFGGYMDIDKFREHFKSNKIVAINMFPMTSLSLQLQEINECELNNEFKYIPIDNDRITNYKKSLLFKRDKPLINMKHSLENYMNFT